MVGNLSKDDVVRLMKDPSAENRSVTAEKIATQFSEGALNDSESKLAEEIFSIMVRDAETRVREALAQNLRYASHLPHDTAVKLANDLSDSVAIPMIESSSVLSDEDLIEIVRTQSADRQIAIAERPVVSENVSDAIVDYGNGDAVVSLVSNPGAQISGATLVKVVDKHGDDERIHEPLVHRENLPVLVAEKLVAKISDDLQAYLVANHDLPEEVATDLILQSRERATVGLLSTTSSEAELDSLIRQLHRNNRLTPSIILRALCVGDLAFFEASIAFLSEIPVTNARILIYDEGALGFKSLFAKAGLPKKLFPAFRSALDLNMDTERERTDDDPEQLVRRMLEHVLTSPENADDEYGVENVDYLLAKFNRIEKPRDEAAF